MTSRRSKLWHLYILLCANGSFYTGVTTDLQKRLETHIQGKGAKYTRSHKAVRIIYTEKYRTRGKALSREIQIKKMTRPQKELLVVRK